MSGAFGLDESSPASAGGVTLLAGTAFVRCRPDGAIVPGGLDGYYTADTRMLDRLTVTVDGRVPFLDRAGPDAAEQEHVAIGTTGPPTAPELLVTLRLHLGARLVLDVTLENLTPKLRRATVAIEVGSDFADVFQVKRGEPPADGFVGTGVSDGTLLLAYRSGSFRRAVRVSCEGPARFRRGGVDVELDVRGGGRATVRATFSPELGDQRPVVAAGAARREVLDSLTGAEAPTGDDRVASVWHRSCRDLSLLLMADPDEPARTVVAAGAPWFLALFGRDALLTSWATLPHGTDLAASVLAALADRQGTREDATSLEQPGRILHEVRTGERVRTGDGWGATYYGSIDATPLFLMVLDEARRHGLGGEDLDPLVPAAEAAGRWLLARLDEDLHGLLSYGHRDAQLAPDRNGPAAVSLVNLGWKDSDDGIVGPDGSPPQGPIALVEVQGYAVRALRGLAALREDLGHDDPAPLHARADHLAATLEERFWMADEGTYALALDGEGEQVRTVTSNPGHLLWCGVVPPDRVAPLADRLMADDLFTGFGLRTLSSIHLAYNPLGYHRGTVWPHDSALCAIGLLANGCERAAQRLARGLIDAADDRGRLPELFAGFPRERYEPPLPYPTSCAPQAWAAAAGLLACGVLGATGGHAAAGTAAV